MKIYLTILYDILEKYGNFCLILNKNIIIYTH